MYDINYLQKNKIISKVLFNIYYSKVELKDDKIKS